MLFPWGMCPGIREYLTASPTSFLCRVLPSAFRFHANDPKRCPERRHALDTLSHCLQNNPKRQWTLSPFCRKLREVKDLVKGNRASTYGRWQVNSVNLTQSQCSFISMMKPPRFHPQPVSEQVSGNYGESALHCLLLCTPTPEVPRTSALEGLSITLTPPLSRQFQLHWILWCRVRCLP